MSFEEKNRTMVIIAEDDPDDRLLIRDAIREAGSANIDIRFVSDGAELLDYLYRRGRYGGLEPSPLPELVLLDINMPKKTGLEVLEEIKADRALKTIPVVLLTTSRSREHIERSYELGGAGFVTKPSSYTELVELMASIEKYWFKTVQLP